MGEGASKLIIVPNSYKCCTLRTGAKFIAIMDMIFSVLSILFVTIMVTLEDKTKNKEKTQTLMYFSLSAALLSFVGAAILLAGILQYRRWLFVPYLVFTPLSAILNLVALGLSVPEVPVYLAVPLGMLSILSVYNWIIVLSYFGELQDEEDEETADTDSD